MCRAVNPAGVDEEVVKLTVIGLFRFYFLFFNSFAVPPDIPDQSKVDKELVLVGASFSLYCPVFSTPIPEVDEN